MYSQVDLKLPAAPKGQQRAKPAATAGVNASGNVFVRVPPDRDVVLGTEGLGRPELLHTIPIP